MPDYTPSEAVAFLKSATQERLAKFELDIAELRAKELSKTCKAISCTPEPLAKPPVSEAQRAAMGAAASGNSTLDIPKDVGQDFIDADKGGKLPAKKKTKKSEPPTAKPPSGKSPTPTGNTVPTSKAEDMTKTDPGTAQHQARQHLLADSSRQALAPTTSAPQAKLPSAQENEARANMYQESMAQVKAPAHAQSLSPVMKRRVAPKSTAPAGPVLNAARPAPAKPGIFGVLSRRIMGG